MAGILDLLTGQTGASPWNALYPSPLNGEADQAQQAREAAAAALARRFRGAPAARRRLLSSAPVRCRSALPVLAL